MRHAHETLLVATLAPRRGGSYSCGIDSRAGNSRTHLVVDVDLAHLRGHPFPLLLLDLDIVHHRTHGAEQVGNMQRVSPCAPSGQVPAPIPLAYPYGAVCHTRHGSDASHLLQAIGLLHRCSNLVDSCHRDELWQLKRRLFNTSLTLEILALLAPMSRNCNRIAVRLSTRTTTKQYDGAGRSQDTSRYPDWVRPCRRWGQIYCTRTYTTRNVTSTVLLIKRQARP